MGDGGLQMINTTGPALAKTALTNSCLRFSHANTSHAKTIHIFLYSVACETE